jgi:MFS family permease
MSTVTYGQLVRRNRNFRLFWAGQIVSQLGDWFSSITVQALLIAYTHEVTAAAGYTVAAMLPGLLLGPIAGVVVDRLPRKSVMIGADLIRAAIALGLLFFRGPETVWLAYACTAGLSCLAVFFEPARISTLPNITSDEELVTANALSSVTWSILLTSGALVGGIVARFFGANTTFVLNSLSFIASALLLSGMKVPPTRREPGDEKHPLREIVEGFSYALRHRPILGALTAKLGWGLAGGMQALILVYGQRLYPLPNDRNGQLSISLLFAAGGLGTALGPVIARHFVGRDLPKMRWAIAVSFVAGGCYYLAMSRAPGLAAVAGLLFLARMHGAVIWVFSTVLLQILTADRFRGRVFAAEGSLFTATMMVSNLGVARAMDAWHVGAPTAALLLGLISAAIGVLWIVTLRRPDA